VVIVAAVLLADTERGYLLFIESLDDVEIRLVLLEMTKEGEKTIIHFGAFFHNTSDLTMYVEALNTQVYIKGEYAGAHHITEGHHRVPPHEVRAVPLQVVLWERRARLLQEAQASGEGELRVLGRARVLFETGGANLKVFYDVEETFPLQVPPEAPDSSSEGARQGAGKKR